ncbi:MAG TPA: BREX protein BrxB domain-containing protein [Pirellulales bacterium]|nr:BREX protein BrxB domain-containing protein [Pirellulales bacterium]
MSRIDLLRKNYQRICRLPWDHNTAGPQRVWLAVYDKEDERKLRLRLGLFREATEQAGHHWHAFDCTDAFADWLANPPYSDYAESYFESPPRLGTAPLAAFKKSLAADLSKRLQSVEAPEDTVVAVYGVASLFGFLRISELLPLVEDHIRGRLLVFFPGVYEQDNYRLLDARDGWNYHAVPITAGEGELHR